MLNRGFFMSPHEFTILKATVPYLHPGLQPMLRLYLAYNELVGSVMSLRATPFPPPGASLIDDRLSYFDTLQSICSPGEKNVLQQMQFFESMMQMLNAQAAASASGGDSFDVLSHFLTPEQQSNLEMLKMMMEMNEASI